MSNKNNECMAVFEGDIHRVERKGENVHWRLQKPGLWGNAVGSGVMWTEKE